MLFFLLYQRGVRVQTALYKDKYDLLLNGRIRIEVKTGKPRWVKGVPTWCFNIHRHGVLDESAVDFYVLRLEGVPYFRNAIHLLRKAPIGAKSVVVSLGSLLAGNNEARDFQALCDRLSRKEK